MRAPAGTGPIALLLVLPLTACVHRAASLGLSGERTAIDGTRWSPPPGAVQAVTPPVAAPGALPAELAGRARRLTLADVVDVALRNNPATRVAWEQARAAAATYGAAGAAYWPTVNGSVTASRSQFIIAGRGASGVRTQYGPAVSLSYLLLDFGGRAGAVDAARQRAFAAGFTYNAVLESTVLQVEEAFFGYAATRALLDAERAAVTEARANLAAAEQRRAVGLSTIADVLQARTALSQAELTLETTEGNLQGARAALALGMGLPPDLPYDVNPSSASLAVRPVADSVERLITAAVRNRPELQAALAQARAAAADVRVSRAAEFPSLLLGGNGGRTYAPGSTAFSGTSYGLSLGLSIPLFNGFARQYDVRAAQARAAAATAQAAVTRNQIIAQVFTSYYALRTGTQRVASADALLTSAVASEQVAAGRYRAGVGSIIDLLTAQSALASARAQQVQARWQWATALAQLARDAGVLGARGQNPIALAPDTVAPPPAP